MRMSLAAIGLAASVLALGGSAAAAQEPPPRFRAPELVVAIVYNEFERIRSPDSLREAIRGRYFDGFAAILDRTCRFLPAATNDAVRARLDALESEASGNRDPNRGVLVSAAASGIADGRAFADRFGCNHSKTERAQRHLGGLFGGAIDRPAGPHPSAVRRTPPRAQ